MSRHNRTGRSKKIGGQFAALPLSIAETPAWRDLSGFAVKAWLDIVLRYDGHNNGRIVVSGREVAARIGVSHATAARAILELENAGFLRLMKASSFGEKRKAAEYRLTHRLNDMTGDAPTHEYKRPRVVNNVVPIPANSARDGRA
jgi:hypothetical protein